MKREEIGKIIDDIETLESSDKVEGVPSALDGSGSGAGPPDGLTNIGTGMFAYVQFKGAAYELRVARKLLDDGKIADSDVLKMDYQPDVDFTELSNDQIQDIADKVYDGDVNEARSALGIDSGGKQPQFDGFKISSNGGKDIYYEMKNKKNLDDANLQKKGAFMLAYNKLPDSDTDVSTI